MAWNEHKGTVSRYFRSLKRKGLIYKSIAVGRIGTFTIYRDYLVPTHKKGHRPTEKFSVDKEMEKF